MPLQCSITTDDDLIEGTALDIVLRFSANEYSSLHLDTLIRRMGAVAAEVG